MENWSALTAIINASRFVIEICEKFSGSSHEKMIPPTPVSPPVQEEQEQIEPYQTQLGRRHKSLRENILKLNPREMANFYGFEEVEKLEKCEAGLEEFPTKAMKKLEDFFFVDPKYLQEGKNPIFQTFRIGHKRDDCLRLLKQGFHPYFLCSPSFNHDSLAYLVFWKEEGGYWQMIRSNSLFSSGGGGYDNIHNLIDAMLDLDMDPRESDFFCLNVSKKEWDNLNKRCWYNKEMRGYYGAANWEAEEIFESWFEAAQTKRMSRNKNSIFHEH
jgi:hypothetical protein